MKKSTVTWLSRRIVLGIVIFVLGVGAFLIPYGKASARIRSRSLARLAIYQNEASLAADELEPYRYTAELPEIELADAGWSVEAESAELPHGARVQRKREGFSGIGYVTGLPSHTESALVIPVTVPYSQHYSVTLCVASNFPADGIMRINGATALPYTLNGGAEFIRITFYGIFLQAGDNVISIDTGDGETECDYVEMNNDNSVYNIDFDIRAENCDPNASEQTKKLYHFLRNHWGSHMLTGQYVSSAQNRELSLIYAQTGQLPAIRFGELGTDNDASQVEAACDWALTMHGIVGFMWQWGAPDSGSVYAAESNYNLKNALDRVDLSALAVMSYDDAASAVSAGQLPKAVLPLLHDIDSTARSLRVLADLDIPVLWRPLHEAGGGWYWWGAFGEESYQKLWKLLFQRLTSYHDINNLIWIWNGQSTSYLVPVNTFDIAAVDVYLPPDHLFGSRYEQYLSLARITDGKKLLALSECSALPDLEMLLLDQSIWSFFGLWYGEYIMNADGTFADTYYSSNDLYNLYNSEFALSLNDFLSIYQ